jgi:hypothetical protein
MQFKVYAYKERAAIVCSWMCRVTSSIPRAADGDPAGQRPAAVG